MLRYIVLLSCFLLLLVACKKSSTDTPAPSSNTNVYTGTASVSQGIGTSTTVNLFPPGIRISGVGSVSSSDAQSWIMPAATNYLQTSFPFASDLHNIYTAGHSYANANAALNSLNGNDIITIDATGEVFTAFIFADNYFELYVNGSPVGKDPVPYTEFNSCIVRFKVKRPFTLAAKCVDWEEKFGLGVELNGANPYYVGDGGFVLVLKDASGAIVTTTDASWKAQTFYTAPITDLSCPTESGNYRYTTNCNTTNASATSYALHWLVPNNWYATSFDDSKWPAASLFSNTTVGVNNKASYTNFTDIFDNSSQDASFIWSTNLLLDNEVLFRKTVQ